MLSTVVSVLAIYDLGQYSQKFLRTNSLERGTRCQKQYGKLINTAQYMANGAR